MDAGIAIAVKEEKMRCIIQLQLRSIIVSLLLFPLPRNRHAALLHRARQSLSLSLPWLFVETAYAAVASRHCPAPTSPAAIVRCSRPSVRQFWPCGLAAQCSIGGQIHLLNRRRFVSSANWEFKVRLKDL